jgi:uncharacterized protein (TIGR02996 family)
VTSEDDFQKALDANPQDWHTRLVFADWLEDRGERRAAGYRAIAALRRFPLKGEHGGLRREGWWWHCAPADSKDPSDNNIPGDWFALLPARYGNKNFWPLHTATGGIRTRRQCEDALAQVFTKLPAERQKQLLATLPPDEPKKPAPRKRKAAPSKAKKAPSSPRPRKR